MTSSNTAAPSDFENLSSLRPSRRSLLGSALRFLERDRLRVVLFATALPLLVLALPLLQGRYYRSNDLFTFMLPLKQSYARGWPTAPTSSGSPRCIADSMRTARGSSPCIIR